MARSIIPKSLKPDAKLKWIELNGKELYNEADMVELASNIMNVLQVKHRIEMKSKQRSNRNDNRNQNQNRGDKDKGNDSNKDMHKFAPCRKHDGKYLWKDRPPTIATARIMSQRKTMIPRATTWAKSEEEVTREVTWIVDKATEGKKRTVHRSMGTITQLWHSRTFLRMKNH